MTVGNGKSQGIRRIVRLGNLLQPQEGAGHLLNLLLLRPAVANNRILDLQRGVFKGLNPILTGSKKDYPPRLSNVYGGCVVCVEIKLFKRYTVRAIVL